MPEEPDVSPEDMEILDRILQERIEAKERERADQVKFIANRILEALHARPDGMNWAEIRDLFAPKMRDKEIRQALLKLETTGFTRNQMEQNGEYADERWFPLAAA